MPTAPLSGRGGRIHTLDSLRGLAALVVVLYHWSKPFDGRQWTETVLQASFWQTPLLWPQLAFHLALAGPSAVIVFFVISGFVLALSLHRPGESYGRFVVKRVFRIYPPYAVALSLAILLYLLVSPSPMPQLSSWFNGSWYERPTLGIVAGHFAMLGSATYEQLIHPSWSLVHEMRISLVFPLLFYAVRKSWRVSLAVAFLVSFAARLYGGPGNSLLADWMLTIFYAVLFVAGAALAEHGAVIKAWLAGRDRATRLLLWALALVLLLVPDVRLRGFAMYFTGLGAAGIVALCYADVGAEWLLHARVARYLGRISYSLYLVHQPIILAVLHLFYGRASLWLLVPAGLILTFITADLLNRLVEVPFQAWGRLLSGDRRRVQAA